MKKRVTQIVEFTKNSIFPISADSRVGTTKKFLCQSIKFNNGFTKFWRDATYSNNNRDTINDGKEILYYYKDGYDFYLEKPYVGIYRVQKEMDFLD